MNTGKETGRLRGTEGLSTKQGGREGVRTTGRKDMERDLGR